MTTLLDLLWLGSVGGLLYAGVRVSWALVAVVWEDEQMHRDARRRR